MTTAATILAQLGGNRFLAMTGAQCLDTGTGLQMKLPKISRLSCVVVELDEGTDTYTVTGYTGRGVNITQAGEPIVHVHADALARVFSSITKLDTKL